MSTITGPPPKMLGRFTGSVRIDSMTRTQNNAGASVFATDGVVSGDLHVNGNLKTFSYRVMNDQVDQSATDIFLKDNVAESGDFEITIAEQRLWNTVPLVEQIAFAGYMYYRVQRSFLPPGATVPQVFYAICSLQSFDGGDVERGPMDCTIVGTSCGISPVVQSTSSALLY